MAGIGSNNTATAVSTARRAESLRVHEARDGSAPAAAISLMSRPAQNATPASQNAYIDDATLTEESLPPPPPTISALPATLEIETRFAPDVPVIRMDRLRDMILQAFSSGFPQAQES